MTVGELEVPIIEDVSTKVEGKKESEHTLPPGIILLNAMNYISG